MTDGLKDKYRKAIIEILSANERVEKVVLFGSRAMGTFTPTSDVDIALFGDQLTMTDQAKLAEAINELSIPQRVDILLYKSIKNEKLIEHIKRHGVEWYRRSWAMGSEWRLVNLGDIAENASRPFDFNGQEEVIFVNTGDVLEGKFLHSNRVSPEGLPGQAKKKIVRGDILFSEIRPGNKRYALVDFDPENYVVSTKFMVIRLLTDEIDPSFFYLQLTDLRTLDEFQRIAESRSGTFPQITFDSISHYPINLPPLSEQSAIAHILGSLDDKIELNRRMNEMLEAMARAIFKSWFIDFLPVRAKMAAANKTPYVSTLPAAEKGKWFVYAIECYDGSIYIGQTEDLRQRWQQHSSGKGGRWTKGHPPVRVVHWELLPSRQEAIEREKWLKTGYGRKWLKQTIAAASARTRTGDPVRAKAEGRDPLSACGHAQAGGLPDEISVLFPDSFEDSELGEIPKGWEPSTIGSDFNLTMGQSPPGKTYNETGDGLPFFQGRRDFGFRFPTNRVYCTAPKRLADHGDTLVSVRAPVGDINMAMARCCVGRGVAGIRHKSGSRSYTYYAMHTLIDRFARFEAEGTVFGAINKKQFEGLHWLSPPGDLVNEFEKIAFPLDERIEKNTNETVTLSSLRDTLLPKLISGDLRVPDAEKLVEGAA